MTNDSEDEKATPTTANDAKPAAESAPPEAENAETAEKKAETAEKKAERPRRPRKEKVLHTRVPAVLEQELKNLAESFRMPVSNLVRAILEDTIEAMDSLGRAAEGEIREVAALVARERERLRQPLDRARSGFVTGRTAAEPIDMDDRSDEPAWNHGMLEGALGFTALVVASDSICPITGDRLPAGSDGFLALFADPSRNIIVSPRAVPSRGA